MNRINFGMILTLICGAAYCEEVSLLPNKPVSYVFSNLSPTTETTGGYNLKYIVTFGGDGLSKDEKYWVRFFEDETSITPLYDREKYWPFDNTIYERSIRVSGYNLDIWQTDFEGRIEFEHSSGTLSIISVKVIIPDGSGGYLSQTMTQSKVMPTITSNGTPYIWLNNVGYNANWESADLEDPDRDGFLNWQEYTADTDPNNTSNFLQVGISNGALNFDSSSACVYRINFCNDLQTRNWELQTNNISGSGDEISVPLGDVGLIRFYQLQAERMD